MKPFRMPSLGADMDEGTLVEWLKAPGDAVSRGEVVAVVETQKGAIEIETFDDGVLDDLRVSPGETVPVGTVLATIRTPGEAPGDAEEATPRERAAAPGAPASAAEAEPVGVGERAAAGKSPAAEAPPAPRGPAPRPSGPAPAAPRTPDRRATPAAHSRAERAGIDLSALTPGPDGIVGLAEVEAALAAAAPPKRPAGARRTAGGIDRAEMRRAIATAMARANREIPHYHVVTTIDVTPLLDWVASVNADRPVAARVMYAAPLLKAVALVLKETPELNGHHGPDGFEPSERVHLSTAVALRGGGLMNPAIFDVDRLSVDETMARLTDLVKRVRGGGIRGSELTAGTATVTNLGEETADTLLPVITPPQVAIVGIGQVRERPWVHDGAVVPRRLIDVTVAGDHRVSDGRTGAAFLARLAKRLERPEAL